MNIMRSIKFDLSQYCSDWVDSYLILKTLTAKQVLEFKKKSAEHLEDEEKALNFIIETVKNSFISGYLKGKEIKSEDIDGFDLEILTDIIRAISGGDKKK